MAGPGEDVEAREVGQVEERGWQTLALGPGRGEGEADPPWDFAGTSAAGEGRARGQVGLGVGEGRMGPCVGPGRGEGEADPVGLAVRWCPSRKRRTERTAPPPPSYLPLQVAAGA